MISTTLSPKVNQIYHLLQFIELNQRSYSLRMKSKVNVDVDSSLNAELFQMVITDIKTLPNEMRRSITSPPLAKCYHCTKLRVFDKRKAMIIPCFREKSLKFR